MHDPLDGEYFGRDEWPHHTTLAGVFTAEPARIINGLDDVARKSLPLESTVKGHGALGYGHDIKTVALLTKTEGLIRLSSNLVRVIQEQDGVFKQPTFLGDRFTPHVTFQSDDLARFAIGAIIRFDRLLLVDLSPGGDRTRRRVIWKSSN